MNELELVLSALVTSLNDPTADQEIVLICIGAILNTISNCGPIFKDGKGNIILDQVIKCCVYQHDEDVRTIAMECIGEVIDTFYDYIVPFMPIIKEVTVNACKGDTEGVRKQALEVWSGLAEQESFKRDSGEDYKRILESDYQDVLYVVIENLMQIDAEDEDTFDSTLLDASQSAALCLQNMAVVLQDAILEPVCNFAIEKIEQNNWKMKYCGLLALGTVMEFESRDFFQQLLGDKIEAFLELMQDPSTQVRRTASWVFSKIALKAPGLISNEEILTRLFDVCINGIKVDTSQVACNQSEVIANIAKNFPTHMETNFFSSRMGPTLKTLLKFSYNITNGPINGDLSQNGINGFATIYALIEKIPNDQQALFKEYIEIFYNLMNETNDPQYEYYSRKEEFQSYLTLGLQTIFYSMTETIGIDIAQTMIQMLLACFKQRKEVFDEAFLLISALCTKFESEMDQFVPEIGPYLFHSLKDKNLSKNAATLISDFCTVVESKNIVLGFSDYTPLLMEMLVQDNLEREAKLTAITALSDTISATEEQFEPFFPQTLQLFTEAARLSADLKTDLTDREYFDYLTNLQGVLIEAFTSITQGIPNLSQQTQQAFLDFVPQILEFLVNCTNDRFKPDSVSALSLTSIEPL